MADSVPDLSSYFTDEQKKPGFLLLYGSETGNAEAITADLVEQAAERGLDARRYPLNDQDKKFNIEREPVVVIVTSTTGEGDPPDNALRFMKRIKKRTLPNDYLQNVSVTLLGLGDSNYTNFCNCGKTMWSALMDLGGREFYAPGWADDATGLELVVEPWIDGLWAPLMKAVEAAAADHRRAAVMGGDGAPSGVVDRSGESANPIGNGHLDHVTLGHVDNDIDALGNEAETKDEQNTEENTPSCQCDLCQSKSLCNEDLTIPQLQPPFLRIEYNMEDKFDTSKIPILNGMRLPSSAGDVVMATVSKTRQLSRDDALKKALEVELDVSGSAFTYEPGDSFSVVCQNDPGEVDRLLERLGLTPQASVHYVITLDPHTKKRNAQLPKHVPCEATLRHTLTHCCDLRAVPKKAFLRTLIESTSSQKEQRRLQEFCSKEGQTEFAKYIREPNLGLLDILDHFKTCQPPIERLLEHLTPLNPRPYSACSSEVATPGKVNFVFNMVEIESREGRSYARRGVCTGWLDRCTQRRDLDTQLEQLSIENEIENEVRIPIFMRTHNNFHLPEDPSVPVIMIGPGTGVAPFIGFLNHRRKLIETGLKFGDMWLLFGCRHPQKDYLYQSEIQEFVEVGALSRFSVCFSRDRREDEPRYVQDLILQERATVVEWLERGAHVYVCGEARHMARDVFEAFVKAVGAEKGVPEKEARALMMTRRLKKAYHEDVWT